MMKKNILITGGAGFIGSNLTRLICSKSQLGKVVVLDSLSYAANISSLDDLIKKNKIKFIKGSITNKKLIKRLLAEYEINYIINSAAETHVDRSIQSPYQFMETNILGTYNLLEEFKAFWYHKNKPNNWKFLHISTDEVFGSLSEKELPFNELSNYKPSSPYSSSKAASDHLVSAWHHTYDLPTIICNCSNNYGPYQYPEKLIPLTLINIINGNNIEIYGKGRNIRDWIFVGDHCNALIKILEKGKIGESYCIGGNSQLTNFELVDLICRLADIYAKKIERNLSFCPSSKLIRFVKDRAGHDFRYAIDSSKLIKELDWEPKVSLEKGLEITVEWYFMNQKWWEHSLRN